MGRDNESRIPIIKGYLLPVMAQAVVVAIIASGLKKMGTKTGYTSAIGMVLIGAVGISSALWGILYQRMQNNRGVLSVVKDFFDVRQPVKAYALVFVFIFITFIDSIVTGGFRGVGISTLLLLFLKAVLFGGIEEIGWRYTFQPEVEKKVSYIPATLITFICWGIWHFLFFYVDGSMPYVNFIPFYLGLLSTSFILSALFKSTNSLWICVMTHALLNAFSQVEARGAVTGTDELNFIKMMCIKVICIALAVVVARDVSAKEER